MKTKNMTISWFKKRFSASTIVTAVVASFVGLGVAYAYTWSTETVTGGDFSESIDVVVQSSTQQDVSFVNASGQAYYAEQISGVWTAYQIESSLPGPDLPSRFDGTSITIDTGNVPVVTFIGNANDDLYIARDDGTLSNPGDSSSWTYDVLLAGTTVSPSMGINSSNVIGVAFGNNNDIYYAYESAGGVTCTLANWECEQIDDALAGTPAPRLIFNGATPIIAYISSTNKINVAIRDGGGTGNCTYSTQWNCYAIDPGANTKKGASVGLALNASSQIILAYIDDDDGTTLKYAVNDGGTGGGCTHASWSCSTISAATDYGYPIDLDFYSSGNMPFLIAQDDTAGEVEFFYNSGSWLNDTIGTFGFNDYAAIDIASSYAGIAWYSNTSGGILSYSEATFNAAPTVSTAPARSSQSATGNGYLTFTVSVDDADDNNLKVKVEYSDDGGSTWYDPDLVSVVASTGTPDLNDANTYQIGTTTPVSTANTLTIVWDTLSASNGNGTLDGTDQSDIQVRITPNDATVDGTATASASFEVDDLDPAGLASLATGSVTTATIPLTWTAVGTETNFDHYEIWYGTTQADVQTRAGGATEWDNRNDANLATMSQASTTITGRSVNTRYYLKIWAVDDYGNEQTLSDINTYTLANAPGTPTVNGATTTTLNVAIDTNSNPAATTFAIYETVTSKYVQANGTLGDSAVWQVVGTDANQWGDGLEISGKAQVTGLNINTQYTFKAKAKDGGGTETAYGSTASAYTLATASSAPTVNGPTTTTLNVTISQGSNPSNTTYQIQETGSSNYVQANGTLGGVAVWQTSATWGTVSGVDGKIAVSGLTSNTQYTFKTTAKNGEGVESAASDPTSAYTAAAVPGAPTVDGATTSTLAVTINQNSNNSSVGYYIYESNTAQYVQADGTLGGVAVWQTSATWGTVSGTDGKITVTGLSVNTAYSFLSKARNGNSVETTAGAATALYTLANVPSAPTVTAASSTSLSLTINTNSNPASTTYAIQDVGSSNYVQADGSLGVSAVWQTNATWGTVAITGLSVNTSFTFKVGAKNGDGTATALSSASTAVYTLVNIPTSASASASGNNISISWSANGNPADVQYYVTRSDGTVIVNWVTGVSATDSGPTCGVAYAYTIKARNTVLVEASTTTTGSATIACGGTILLSISRGSSRDDSEHTETTSEDRSEDVSEDVSVDEAMTDETTDETVREATEETTNVAIEGPMRNEIEYERAEPAEFTRVDETTDEAIEDLVQADESAPESTTNTEEIRSFLDRAYDFFSGDIEEEVPVVEDTLDLSQLVEDLRSDMTDIGYDKEFTDAINSLQSFLDESTAGRTELSNVELASTGGSVDTDRDGISDAVEAMHGTDANVASGSAADVFYGGTEGRNKNTPVVTAGSFQTVAIMNKDGGVFLGTYKPNEQVTMTVRDERGKVLTEIISTADDNGKFLVSLGAALSTNGVKDGDILLVTVASKNGKKGKPVVIKIGKTADALEIDETGRGAERLSIDPEELDYENVIPDQWCDMLMTEFVPSFIRGTKYEEGFVAALNELKQEQGAAMIFTGTAKPGTMVVFMFESLITTSVVITDADGNFSIDAPEDLAEGVHKYTGFVTNPRNNSVSVPVRGVLKFTNLSRVINEMLLKFEG